MAQLDARAAPELLLEERLVTRALIACELGEADEARRALAELDRNNTHSIYRARLEGSCALTPSPARP